MKAKVSVVSTLAVAAVAATLTGVAHADSTINGAIGLPLNPTAQIPNEGGIRVQGDYFDANGGEFYGIHAAGRVGDRLEINGGVERISGGGNQTGIAIGAKYLISRETEKPGVRLAAGVGYSKVLLDNIHGYLVASKYLGQLSEGRTPITGHLGLRYDHFDAGLGNSDKASVFAGVEAPFTREGDLAFVGELGSKIVNGGSTPYSASLRYRPAGQPYSASVGVQRYGLFTGSNLFVQVGYTFNTK